MASAPNSSPLPAGLRSVPPPKRSGRVRARIPKKILQNVIDSEASNTSNTSVKASWFTSSQSMVTFVIGKDEVRQTYLVHKELAAFHSPFFKAAFESQMIEGQTQTMRLEDVESGTFGLLNGWLYTGKIDESRLNGSENLLPLAKLWSLGGRGLIPRLQNCVMSAMYAIICSAPNHISPQLKAFNLYAFRTSKSEILQRLALRTTMDAIQEAPEGSKAEIEELCDIVPHRMWREVCVQLLTCGLRGVKSPFPKEKIFMVVGCEQKSK